MIEIIKRLEIIKNGIAIEDVDLINLQVKKIKELQSDPSISSIIQYLDGCDYVEALKAISTYIYNVPASLYIDTGLSALRLEFKFLCEKFEKICTHKSEYLMLLETFRIRYMIALGDSIQNILNLQILIAQNKLQQNPDKDKTEYEQAQEKYESFKEEFKTTIKNIPVDFSEETFSKDSTEVLRKLYVESVEITDKTILNDKIITLKNNIASIENEINDILEDSTFTLIVSLKDWDAYFNQIKEKLEVESSKLQQEVKEDSLKDWDTYLNQVKQQLEVASSELQQEVKELPFINYNESWMSDLWEWADKNNISPYQYAERYKKYIGLPRSREQLISIIELNLESNQITDLPESIGKLIQLTHLALTGNKLSYLPESIGNLTQLVSLTIEFNRNLNSLPESICNLTQLNQLSLTGNRLTSLPELIGNLTQLTKLELSDNQITTFPESICNLTRLICFSIDDKKVSFTPNQKIWFENLLKNTTSDNSYNPIESKKSEWINTSDNKRLNSNIIKQETIIECDKDEYNSRGYDSHGSPKYNWHFVVYDKTIWNKNGINKDALINSEYEKELYEKYGWIACDKYGYDRQGYDKDGWNKDGYNRYVSDKNDQKRYKSNWIEFKKIIELHNIKKLYHFTDESNMAYIEQTGGLYSWLYLEQTGITIPRPGGDNLSRRLDTISNLQDYVRLSFHPNQPMKYVAKKDGRIHKCIIIEINPEVIYWDSTLFSDQNATASNSIIGGNLENFKNIDFNLLKKGIWSSNEEKKRFQAEVLVKTHIPIKYILSRYPD